MKAPSSTGKWFCLYFQLRRPLRRKTRSNFACLAVTFCPFRHICENHLFTFSILRRGVRPSTTNLTQRSWVVEGEAWTDHAGVPTFFRHGKRLGQEPPFQVRFIFDSFRCMYNTPTRCFFKLFRFTSDHEQSFNFDCYKNLDHFCALMIYYI